MDIKELKNLLVEKAGYPDNGVTEQTARRLLSFGGKASEMLKAWIENGAEPHFGAVEGIDSEFLRKKLGMKAPALIIAYAMLEVDPEENAAYLKNLAENRIEYHPDQK